MKISENMQDVRDVLKGLKDYPIYIQYSGVFDMQDLFETIIDFLRNQKFKFNEKLNFRKNPGPFGFEEKHKWFFWKLVEDYYKYEVDIYVHAFDLQDIQVKLPNGETKNYNKGRVWVQIIGEVKTDYEGQFDSNLFYKQLKAFYHKYVIQKKAEAIWWDELHYKTCVKLRNVIQQRLKMESEEFEHRYFAGVH